MSAYCPLEDAFQDPGCGDGDAARQARKEERRKRRKTPAPLPYAAQDFDRQHLQPPEDIPAMRGAEDFDPYNKATQHAPPSKGPTDPLEEYAKSECSQHYMAVPVNNTSAVISKKGFFGAQGPTDEPFADYEPADFAMAFQRPSLSTTSLPSLASSASSTLAPPVLDPYWKPITPSGAQTSFVEHLPPAPVSARGRTQDIDAMMRKLDQMYNKLEDMNRSTPEQLTSEMLMFVSSGIFVLFLMDLLVKRGSSMRF